MAKQKSDKEFARGGLIFIGLVILVTLISPWFMCVFVSYKSYVLWVMGVLGV